LKEGVMPKIPSAMSDIEEQYWLVQIEAKFKRAIDIKMPTTIDLARQLAKKYPGPYDINQICAIYEYLVAQWKYVDDPRGIEYIAPASISAKNLAGNCEDFAALMAALIESIGGQSRILIASSQKEWHAYTEVFMEHDSIWLNLDWIAHHAGGPLFKGTLERVIYPR
jgi:transglutaminase-like putative cysteine protease